MNFKSTVNNTNEQNINNNASSLLNLILSFIINVSNAFPQTIVCAFYESLHVA